jgi:hypothetical protein
MATYRIPTSNFPAVLNDNGDQGIVRVSSNQNGVTLIFVPYNELPIVKNEKTGTLGRRATVVVDVRLEPGSNDWLIVTTKDVILPVAANFTSIDELKPRSVSADSEWKAVE